MACMPVHEVCYYRADSPKDRMEPTHNRVERAGATAKVWLSPARLDRSRGLSIAEISATLRHVEENSELIVRSWNEFFRD